MISSEILLNKISGLSALQEALPHTLFPTPSKEYQRILSQILPSLQILSPPHFTSTHQILQGYQPRKVQYLFAFKPSPAIEKWAKLHKKKLLMPPSSLCRRLENKLYLPSLAQKAELPLLPQLILENTPEGFSRAKARFGLPFVLQLPKGFGGQGTFLIEDCRQFCQTASKLPPQQPLKATPWLENALTLTLNGCVLPHAILSAPPFLQLTGLPLLTPHPFGACGNDWGFTPPFSISQQCQDIAQRVGKQLRQRGFFGHFGLDFLWHHRRLWLQEINPRFTASFALFAQIQLFQNQIPFLFLHLAHFLSPSRPREGPSSTAAVYPPLRQYIFYSHHPSRRLWKNPPAPGIYCQKTFRFLGSFPPGKSFPAPGEFFFQPTNTAISPGKELGRVLLFAEPSPPSRFLEGCAQWLGAEEAWEG